MFKKIKFMQAIKRAQRIKEIRTPKTGEMAPDFTLRDPRGVTPVTLSELIGQQPVVLVFGSFT